MDAQTEEKLRAGHINTLRAEARRAGVSAKGSVDEIIERMKAAEEEQQAPTDEAPVEEQAAQEEQVTPETPPAENSEERAGLKPAPTAEPTQGDCRECIHYPEDVITDSKADFWVNRTKHFTVRPCGVDPCKNRKFEAR